MGGETTRTQSIYQTTHKSLYSADGALGSKACVSDTPMQFSMRATSKPGSPRNFEVASLQLAASCRVCGPDATQLCCHRLKVHGTIGHQSIGRTRYVPIGIQPIFSCFHGTVPHTFPSFVPNPLAARVCVRGCFMGGGGPQPPVGPHQCQPTEAPVANSRYQ